MSEDDWKNTIHHGDCLDIMKGIPDKSIDLILCDLPYGTTRNKWDAIIPLDQLWAEYKRIAKGPIVLTAQTPFDKILGASNIKMLKYEWIWEKDNSTGFLNANKAPLKIHENILVFYDKPPKYNPQMRTGLTPYYRNRGHASSNYGKQTESITVNEDGTRYPITILKFKRDSDRVHPTQKPIAMMEYFIRTYTDEGDIVLDNCAGSGSTGIACINTGRNYILIEKEQKYIDLIHNKIQDSKIKNNIISV